MIYTDENGNKYELVGEYANPGMVIKPIKEEPKWEVNTYLIADFETDQEIQIFWRDQSQANLIKEAIEALMEYITDKDNGGEWTSLLVEPADKARRALQKDKI